MQEKFLFLQAFSFLGYTKLSILMRSFKQLTHSLEHQKFIPPPSLKPNELKKAILVGKAIGRASKFTPWASTCLVQALTAQRILQKMAIPGVFYLGINRCENVDKELRAHAWSQCGKTIITGADGQETFTVVSAFKWTK